jgi:hypothetical protein
MEFLRRLGSSELATVSHNCPAGLGYQLLEIFVFGLEIVAAIRWRYIRDELQDVIKMAEN